MVGGATDPSGRGAITACVVGDIRLLKLILSVTRCDFDIMLNESVLAKQLGIVKYLYGTGGTSSVVETKCISIAITNDHLAMVRVIVERGVIYPQYANELMSLAGELGRTRILNYLIKCFK